MLPYLSPTHSENGSFGLEEICGHLKLAVRNIENCCGSGCASFPEKRLEIFSSCLAQEKTGKIFLMNCKKKPWISPTVLAAGRLDSTGALSWDKPSPTVVTSPTMPATNLAHPEEHRPLSIAEYMRVQGDNWKFSGNLIKRYKQNWQRCA